jgi:hypothetical protein
MGQWPRRMRRKLSKLCIKLRVCYRRLVLVEGRVKFAHSVTRTSGINKHYKCSELKKFHYEIQSKANAIV